MRGVKRYCLTVVSSLGLKYTGGDPIDPLLHFLKRRWPTAPN